MAVTRKAVELELEDFPPTPSRLLELMELFARMGFSTIFLDFGDTFPWTVDGRFSGASAYPEEVISGLFEFSRRIGLEIIPRLDCFTSLSRMLRIPAYAHLRKDGTEADLLDPFAPGARLFAETLIDDVLRLLPGLTRFHLGGNILAGELLPDVTPPDDPRFDEGRPAAERALVADFIGPLLAYVHENGITPLLCDTLIRDLHDSIAIGALPPYELVRQASVPARGVGGAGPPAPVRFWVGLPLAHAAASGRPIWGEHFTGVPLAHENAFEEWVSAAGPGRPEGFILSVPAGTACGEPVGLPVEAYLEELAHRCASLPQAAPAPAQDKSRGGEEVDWAARCGTAGLRAVFSDFGSALDTAWTEVRAARECLVLVTVEPGLRGRRRREIGTAGDSIRKSFTRVTALRDELYLVLADRIDANSLRRYFTSKIEPLREEIGFIEARACQLLE